MVFEEPRNNFLQKLQEICDLNGTLLIFDEMWTGFRLSVGGAQRYFGVRPDLACYSKAIANGMPLAVLTGRREVMQLLDKDVFMFSTFGGEALSLAAAKATMKELVEKNVPDHLAQQGKKLKDGYNQIAAALDMNYTRCTGMDCRTIVSFDATAGNPLETKSLMQQELIKRGILWAGFHNLSFSHTDEDIAHTLKAYEEILPIVHQAVKGNTVSTQLKGTPVEPVFRRTGNFNMKPKVKAAANS
jgi:glutamate-1-semialdehyde aminotransferase